MHTITFDLLIRLQNLPAFEVVKIVDELQRIPEMIRELQVIRCMITVRSIGSYKLRVIKAIYEMGKDLGIADWGLVKSKEFLTSNDLPCTLPVGMSFDQAIYFRDTILGCGGSCSITHEETLHA